ncbi:nucleotide disphospho-sugar-binding domain-containing protein [Streptomyces sp. 1331.2]|uniref:nucleotide disphospho-sugar-binding domain-containing protein n=1 Tax=Streptomyces sp. 1331.2 TaxID=1938835 RepID=UPI000BC5617F|nr:nucleotide disphospho-sugar-binding domain-containing protein [Streptomyces sp. 1331.2]SOB88690.1 UDP:flavonoid glycosyltransferase YjiC, YdhE family [Streptomyces sp. 1331.2]
MRVLFTAPGAVGHIFPVIPTALALRAAGHDVLFAGQPPVAILRNTGLPVVEIGDGTTLREAFARALPKDVRFADAERTEDETNELSALGFAEFGRSTIDDLLKVAEDWRPDVIVHESFQGAAPLVAARFGIPAVRHNFGVTSGGAAARLRRLLADDYRARGVEASAASTVLDVVPASLGGDGGGWRVRYVPYNGGGTIPADLIGRGTRPRIAVTLGTVFTDWEGIAPLSRLIEQAGALDAEILLAAGDADLTPLGTLPGNVRPLPWVPLSQLLQASDGVVHHGGSGSMMTAAALGVPQLVLPQGADNFANAAAGQANGFALSSSLDAVDTALLDRLLTDDGLRKSAAAMKAEIDALPSPADLVADFEALGSAGAARIG